MIFIYFGILNILKGHIAMIDHIMLLLLAAVDNKYCIYMIHIQIIHITSLDDADNYNIDN